MSISGVATSNLRSINEVRLIVFPVADFCVLHQLSATLHQPEPPGPAVQRPAALPLWLLRRLRTPQEIPLP